MERTDLFDLMGELKLSRHAGRLRRDHHHRHQAPARASSASSAICSRRRSAEKQARSIRYQMTIAKLPLAKELADFEFAGTPINETLVRDLAGGAFLAQQRNVVLIGGTGTGKTHMAIAIARSCIRAAPEAASTTSSISSTGSRARPAAADRAGSPIT